MQFWRVELLKLPGDPFPYPKRIPPRSTIPPSRSAYKTKEFRLSCGILDRGPPSPPPVDNTGRRARHASFVYPRSERPGRTASSTVRARTFRHGTSASPERDPDFDLSCDQDTSSFVRFFNFPSFVSPVTIYHLSETNPKRVLGIKQSFLAPNECAQNEARLRWWAGSAAEDLLTSDARVTHARADTAAAAAQFGDVLTW
ncbi:hypothetical protein J6590_036090 [Homalodisca vitripennis]|nr:hypothetical protein J6590_036084 [Homalodisca vitripennis]KAG8302201.1 hypothetical protein J6590_036090 [Homalodisca vitripennis]